MNNELKKEIYDFLKTKVNNVYFKEAPSKASFPYVVFDLTNSINVVNNREDYVLEITLWDKTQDTTNIDNIRDSINGNANIFNPTGLDRLKIKLNTNIATCNKEAQYNTLDPEKNIERRQINYIIKLF